MEPANVPADAHAPSVEMQMELAKALRHPTPEPSIRLVHRGLPGLPGDLLDGLPAEPPCVDPRDVRRDLRCAQHRDPRIEPFQ